MNYKRDYKKIIGDGKLPNKYFLFHYDEKFKRADDNLELHVPVNETKVKETLLGVFDSFNEALHGVYNLAYLPHVVIEDRLSGQVWESYVVVCPCCGKEDYETIDDHHWSEEREEELSRIAS